nr:hypothetical protein [Tanacetum cinerariifolium]
MQGVIVDTSLKRQRLPTGGSSDTFTVPIDHSDQNMPTLTVRAMYTVGSSNTSCCRKEPDVSLSQNRKRTRGSTQGESGYTSSRKQRVPTATLTIPPIFTDGSFATRGHDSSNR